MTPTRLNIGCGNTRMEGYVGVDIAQGPCVDIVAPAWDIPGEPGTVAAIHSSHMIEHLSPQQFIAALKEWYRLLKPGGKLTIRCPNFELYIEEWLTGGYDYRWNWGIINLYGWQDRGDAMITRTGFTARRLRHLLEAAGFMVDLCETWPTRMTKGPEYRPNGDIYCNARKP